MEAENPAAPSLARFERCLPCPCNAGSCRLLISTKKYAGRKFYICPRDAAEQCKFFKWADKVEPQELINVPYCGGCMAGVCRFTKVAGRILFMCSVEEGQGSCGFRVWQDELHENATLSQPTFIGHRSTGAVNTDMVLDFNLTSDEEPDNEPHLNDASINMNIPSLDATFGKTELLKSQEYTSDELLRTPSKESQDGDKKASERVMNALFLQEVRKKRNGGASSSVITPPTGDSSMRTLLRASPAPTIQAGENPEVQLQDETSLRLRKRKVVVEVGVPQEEHTPITHVEENAEGDEDEEDSPTRPRIHEDYTSQIALLGKDPCPMASRIALDLTSKVDADYTNSLDLTDILQRTCSSTIESLIYAGAAVRRQQVMVMRAHKERREERATFMRLEHQLSQAKDEHARALMELTHETDTAMSKKDAELQAGKELLREMKKELATAHRKLGETQAQAARDKESFREEYLKSADFQAACFKKAFSYLEMGFQGAMDQCRAKGYAPKGASTDFLDFEEFVASLPPDE